MIEHIGERHSEGTSIYFAIKPIHAKKIQENRHVCEKFDESQVESQNTHFFMSLRRNVFQFAQDTVCAAS